MLQFFSKSSTILAGAIVLAGTVVLPLTAISQTVVPVAVTETAPLLVIQGKITAITGSLVTVKTPDTRTSPAVIIAGPTFSVDISSATFQLASGKTLTPPPILVVGNSVIVAGRQGALPAIVTPTPAGPNKLIIAEVVSKIVP
jgi:hypothetical protein